MSTSYHIGLVDAPDNAFNFLPITSYSELTRPGIAGKEPTMHLSIRRYQFDPDDLTEIAERAQTGFVPIIAGAPGFLAYYIVDAGDGVGLTISVFEDEAGAEASTRMAASWVRENLAPLVPDPPTVTEGEVLVYEVA